MSDLNPNYIEVVSTLKYVRLLKGYTLEHVELVTNGEFTKEAVDHKKQYVWRPNTCNTKEKL